MGHRIRWGIEYYEGWNTIKSITMKNQTTCRETGTRKLHATNTPPSPLYDMRLTFFLINAASIIILLSLYYYHTH